MRPTKPFSVGTTKRLQQLLKQARSIADQRRIQAVLMRALDASPPERIAVITGLNVNTVRVLHSRFLREGEAFLLGRPGRGGRRHSLLSVDLQTALLNQHVQAAVEEHIVEAGTFKREYAALVGHSVAATTVYRLLAKAGWRKIVPRPSHPGKQPEAETAFKKSTRTSSRRKNQKRLRG
jgi:transposase